MIHTKGVCVGVGRGNGEGGGGEEGEGGGGQVTHHGCWLVISSGNFGEVRGRRGGGEGRRLSGHRNTKRPVIGSKIIRQFLLWLKYFLVFLES